jgi:hypothetical protein
MVVLPSSRSSPKDLHYQSSSEIAGEETMLLATVTISQVVN